MAARWSEPIPAGRRGLSRRDPLEHAVVGRLRHGRPRPEAPVVVVVTGAAGPDRDDAVDAAAAQLGVAALVVVVEAVAPGVGPDALGDGTAALGWGAARVVDRVQIRRLVVPAALGEVSSQRNVAIRLTASRYVAFLDAGARWCVDHLGRALATLEGGREGGAEVAVSKVVRTAERGSVPHGVRTVPHGLVGPPPTHPAPWGPGTAPDLAAVVTRRVRALRLPPRGPGGPGGPGGTAAAELALCRRLSARLHVALLDGATVCRSV
ncbi:MAG: hypothetical protein R2749_18425 [Acidimicrobiales bacterium]